MKHKSISNTINNKNYLVIEEYCPHCRRAKKAMDLKMVNKKIIKKHGPSQRIRLKKMKYFGNETVTKMLSQYVDGTPTLILGNTMWIGITVKEHLHGVVEGYFGIKIR